VIPDDKTLLTQLQKENYDPAKVILFKEEPEGSVDISPVPGKAVNLDNSSSPRPGAEIVEFSPNRIKLRVNPAGKCWLFLGEIYYPGWKAKVDGKERKVYCANYIFRTVRLYPGEKEVLFYFDSDTLKIGGIITIITIILLFLMLNSVILSKAKDLFKKWRRN
jgi:uncharacterized membrane protein YfhO